MKQHLDLKEEEDLLNKNKKTFKNFDEKYYKPSGFDFKVEFGKEEKNNNLNENLKEWKNEENKDKDFEKLEIHKEKEQQKRREEKNNKENYEKFVKNHKTKL